MALAAEPSPREIEMQVDSFVLSKAAQRKSPRVLQERSDPHYDYRRESPVSLEMQSKALDVSDVASAYEFVSDGHYCCHANGKSSSIFA
jgi:hypothetical protein